MDLTILEIAHHRNGISGAPFSIIRFRDNTENKSMLGIVFEKSAHVAVFDFELLAKGEIRFIHNSWRGDFYEKALRDAIQENG